MNATAATILLLTGISGPPRDGELLPAPKSAPRVERIQPMPPLGFYRPSAYDIWQVYAVGQGGFWRARVIEVPEGQFYLYNGEPYPWGIVNPRNRVP